MPLSGTWKRILADQRGRPFLSDGRILPTNEPHPVRSDPDSGLLRSELLSSDQLKQHAVALAGSHSVDRRPGRDRLLPRLAENERVLLDGL